MLVLLAFHVETNVYHQCLANELQQAVLFEFDKK